MRLDAEMHPPLETGYPLRASRSDLIAFLWEVNGIRADFALDEAQLLRVAFDRPCIVRILDEMALSTEDDGPKSGLVPEHFAYRVEGAGFAQAQSEAWKFVSGPVAHYRFITGWGCLDVLSAAVSTFSLAGWP